MHKSYFLLGASLVLLIITGLYYMYAQTQTSIILLIITCLTAMASTITNIYYTEIKPYNEPKYA